MRKLRVTPENAMPTGAEPRLTALGRTRCYGRGRRGDYVTSRGSSSLDGKSEGKLWRPNV